MNVLCVNKWHKCMVYYTPIEVRVSIAVFSASAPQYMKDMNKNIISRPALSVTSSPFYPFFWYKLSLYHVHLKKLWQKNIIVIILM